MASRRGLVVSLVAVLAVVIGVVFVDDAKVTTRSLHGALAIAATEVAEMANLKPGSPARSPSALPVVVVVDGEMPWLAAEAKRAAALEPAFELGGGPHELRFEYVGDGRTWAVRAQLWRRDWSLRPPEPVIVRIFPWVAVLAAALGGALWVRRVPLWIAAAVSGVGAQVGLWAMAWPTAILRPSFYESVAAGPVGRQAVRWAAMLPETSLAIGAGIVTLCLVLVVFDHRRSPGQGGMAIWTALVVLLAGLAWLEAALRGQIVPWAMTGLGACGALGLVGLWGGCAWTRRTTRRPSDAEQPDAGAR
ncbi:MAG: hypothetical protein JKY37_26225 [Nannocystaceae bacterium]|nr:hypothetical protein [Nannocystaceae bacterium]